jgi:hypothetical protein
MEQVTHKISEVHGVAKRMARGHSSRSCEEDKGDYRSLQVSQDLCLGEKGAHVK